jgi:HEAT repeat protein
LGLCVALGAAPARAESWVDALSALELAPLDLSDSRVPLDARIAQARALGRHGPAAPAIAVLQAALDAEPPPSARLREAIVLALAERDPRAAQEPLKTLLEAAKKTPVARDAAVVARGPDLAQAKADWDKLAAAFERETDPRAMSAQAQALLGGADRLDPRAIERALCEPRAAREALHLLIERWQRAFGEPRAEPLRRRLREALAGSTCIADAGARPAADDPRVARLRIAAAFALGQLADGEAVPALRAALESPLADVRMAAARALQALAAAEIDDEGRARRAACEALAVHARVEIAPRVRAHLTCP